MRVTTATSLLLTLAVATASAQAPAAEPNWGPAPAVFPAGAQMAVMQGNPGKAEMFTVRLKFPNGYAIAPHWHPTDEHLKVMSGTFKVGMGKKVEAAKMMTLNVGDSATAPAKEPHYAKAQGATIVQVNAMGPFAMTYVNPADTPKAAVAKK
jgi:quercetin dioxygenase-like cupin family protein